VIQLSNSAAYEVFLSFCEAVKEEDVRKLDDRIKEVTLFIERKGN
jgi:hypothetical protein